MDDMEIVPLVIGMCLLVIPLSLGLAVWLVMRLRRKSDQPLSRDMTGAILVPVRRLKRRFGFFGHAENSLSPRLAIARDGLQFKVFKPDHWPFPEIDEVDAPPVLFVTRLMVRHRAGARLYIDLANASRARDLLRALPPGLPVTRRAAEMRDAIA